MGKLIKVSCNACGSSWQLRQGYGLMHGRADTVAALFPEDIRAGLPLEAMRLMETPWSFSLEPAVCPDCRALVDVPVLTFPKSGEGRVGVCSRCGGRIQPVAEEELVRVPCPACGVAALKVQDIGLWD